MMNIMRADMYRILRGRAVYIILAIMLVLVGLTVFVFRAAPQTGVVIISSEPIADDALGGVGEMLNEFLLPDAAEVMSGAMAAQIALSSMDSLIYFILTLIIVIVMSMFSCGAVKNELSTGLCRVKLYFAKLALTTVLSFVLMFLYLLTTILFAIFVDGIGYWGDGFIVDALASFVALMVLVTAINSVGLFLSFVTRNESIVIGAYLAILFAPMVIIHLLAIAFPSALEILNYDILNQFGFLSQVTNITILELVRSFAICIVLILVPTFVGITVFKKAEIK